MRGWWQDLTDLVLPAECGGCGRLRTVLCPECRAVLCDTVPCRVRPVPEPAGLPVVQAAAPYEDEVRAVLLAHKERGALALAGPLGAALAGAVRAGLGERTPEAGAAGPGTGPGGLPPGKRAPAPAGCAGAVPEPVLLVPVPSARGAVRARGHDPARRIALAAAGELRRGGTAARVLGVLRQRRPVADQSGLNSRQRLDNLAGALEVAAGGRRLLAGAGRVVLVDDLMTTGASLAEAARAVREACAAQPADTRAYVSRTWARAEVPMIDERAVTADERENRTRTRPDMAGTDLGRDRIRAAVVAASPDAFEINRN
ncbi:ComF family protein [Streptomyces sp. NPDC005907]|uniref:ComF family protein n=1 Tax=Streptomyces sp. NPDC005907 TaxID=3154571 RepID=UPI0033ED1F0D